VVRPVVVFGHGRLLEEVGEFGNLLAAILVAPRVGEEVAIAALSTPESCPESSALADGAMGAAGA
jgi:hypothetical protein